MPLFPQIQNNFPICKECNGPIIDSGCCCGLPDEDPKSFSRNPYINHCWNCKGSIDSRNCVRSSIPGMGYHCNLCGKDLTELKQGKGI